MQSRIVAKVPIFRKMIGEGRQAYWAMFSQLIAGAAAFITSVVIIRHIGLEDFGRFSIAALLIIIVKNFAEGLILAPLASIGPKLNSFAVIPYRGFALLQAVAFFALTSGLIWASLFAAGHISGAGWLSEIAVAVAFATATSGLSDFFRRQQFLIGAPARSCSLEVLRYTVQLALLIGMASITPGYLSTKSAIYITAVSALCSAMLGYKLFGAWSIRLKMMRAAWQRHWAFIRWMVPSVALETLQTMFPFLFASAILGEAALGLLRAAHQITSLLNLPFNALMQVVPSMAARKIVREGPIAVRKFLQKVGGSIVVATTTMGFLVLLLSMQISAMFGISDTIEFGILIFLFMVVNVINALRFSTMVFVNTAEQTWINLAASSVGATIATGLGFTIIPLFGERGVVLTFIAVAAVNWIVLYFWARLGIRSNTKIVPAKLGVIDEK